MELTITDAVRIMQAIGHGDPSVALLTAMTVAQHLASGGPTRWPEELYRQVVPTRRRGRC